MPQRKKIKVEKEKKSKGENFFDKAMESFLQYQIKAEENFRKWEEERFEKEQEIEEIKRIEEQEHEMRLFHMLGQMLKPANYTSSQFHCEY